MRREMANPLTAVASASRAQRANGLRRQRARIPSAFVSSSAHRRRRRARGREGGGFERSRGERDEKIIIDMSTPPPPKPWTVAKETGETARAGTPAADGAAVKPWDAPGAGSTPTGARAARFSLRPDATRYSFFRRLTRVYCARVRVHARERTTDERCVDAFAREQRPWRR
jgi:hypothetical protein